MPSEQKYFNAFNLINGIGPIKFKKLLAYFNSLEKAWLANERDLTQAGLENRVIKEIISKRPTINPDKEFEKLLKEKISVLTIQDKNYPKRLKEIYDPPAILYLRGEIRPEDEFAFGVVGTRKMSHYGQQITPEITSALSKTGLTIVSGLAQGIDTLAHHAALQANGRTIAVLGSGLDWKSIFPSVNQKLAEKISRQGAVISEYPIGAPGLKSNFPARNRIISGLSLGILVIEAPERSGALITAQHALDQNREVFAMPGSIYNQNSIGPNNLIKMGAKLVADCNDILEELNLKTISQCIEVRQIIPETEEESLILNFLSHEPIHIDKIAGLTKLDTALVNSTLAIMEMKGLIKNLGGMNFVLIR